MIGLIYLMMCASPCMNAPHDQYDLAEVAECQDLAGAINQSIGQAGGSWNALKCSPPKSNERKP